MSSKEKNEKEEMIKTREDRTMAAEEAMAINERRMRWLLRLLREKQELKPFLGDVPASIAKMEAARGGDRKKTTPVEADLRTIRAAEGIRMTLDKKGPTSYAFADRDSELARTFEGHFGKPEYTQGPKHWPTKDRTPPELFVPFLDALSVWEEMKAKREEAEKAEREEAEKKQAEAKKKQAEAEAERARQANDSAMMADALFATADAAVLAAADEERETHQEADAAYKAAQAERIKKARAYLSKALRGELFALPYKNLAGRLVVSDKDNNVLSFHRVAELASADPSTDIYSTIDGSVFKDRLDATYERDGKEYSRWFAAQVTVGLRTEDGKVLKGQTATGFIIMNSREKMTLETVAEELGIRNPEDVASFWDTYRPQPLRQKADWAAKKLRESAERRNGRSSSDDPPPKVPETLPEGGGEGLVPEEPRRERKPRRSPEERNEAEGKVGDKPQTEPEDADEVDVDVEEIGDSDILNEAVEVEAEKPDLPLNESGSLTHSPFAAALAAKSK